MRLRLWFEPEAPAGPVVASATTMQRRADDADGRVNRLHLTARGRKKIDALLPQHNEVILKLLGSVSTAQIKSLQGLLEQVERAALSEN